MAARKDQPLDESLLIERARGGDRAALDVLLQEKVGPVLRFGLMLCGHEEDAQEVAQETLLTAYRKLGDFRGESSLSNWLFVVTRSTCRRYRRRRAGEPNAFLPVPTDIDGENPTPEDLVAQRELQDTIRRALSSLPSSYREVLLLRDLQGLPAAGVAQKLGLSLSATKSRIHRARAALARRLGVEPER